MIFSISISSNCLSNASNLTDCSSYFCSRSVYLCSSSALKNGNTLYAPSFADLGGGIVFLGVLFGSGNTVFFIALGGLFLILGFISQLSSLYILFILITKIFIPKFLVVFVFLF